MNTYKTPEGILQATRLTELHDETLAGVYGGGGYGGGVAPAGLGGPVGPLGGPVGLGVVPAPVPVPVPVGSCCSSGAFGPFGIFGPFGVFGPFSDFDRRRRERDDDF